MNQNKLERLERIQTINFELMDAYRSGLSWMVDYCEKNNLPYPDLNRAYYLIHVSGMMLEQPNFNNHSEHPKKTQNLIPSK